LTTARNYGVKLVRGPFLRLEPHQDHCADEDELRAYVARLRDEIPGVKLAADLFSGAGGMSLGLTYAGFHVVLSADHDREALETHAHHFPGMAVGWDLGEATNVDRIAALIRDLGIDLLAGGPPCQPFSKAGRSGIRHRVRQGLRDPHDQRRDLWRSYLEVIRLARPAAVMMENVPDMALDKEMFILRSMVEELEQLGYSVEEQVVDSRDYGVPQFRQRLILVALRNGAAFAFPPVTPQQVTLWNAIGDMPEVEGGWRPEGGAEGWAEYEGPVTAYQRRMRAGVPKSESGRLYDHVTRPVREDDALAFEHMDKDTRYSHLPEGVKRYRDDIFDDKYKRLDENDLSRTITAHIAKDGYWYIHPRQGRTITVREAARIQSFPDWFRFAGPPSAAFRQIGNAVPPLLAFQLGSGVAEALGNDTVQAISTQTRAAALAEWFGNRTRLTTPWLRAPNRWLVILAEMLLDRLPNEQVRLVWSALEQFSDPETTLEREGDLREIAGWIGREDRVDAVLQAARTAMVEPSPLSAGVAEHARVDGVGEVASDLALLVAPAGADDEEPILVTKGVLKVAREYFGDSHLIDRQNKLTDGRLAVARLVGGGDTARSAHLALIELGDVCVLPRPRCQECPLSQVGCRRAQRP
jgi:DNA (cytosine-5)-methyltransferase 1